ncbi:AraC family ligand binding domain-containing protein [Parabacteroides sp. OttesenSCG-928-J18]|nr:AraC family ligand binding domain-containing protein [Parabacteroides sp. OttesenSCG-928-J18]
MIKQELKRDFILLNVGDAYHDADWNWKDIHSPFARIHYVKSGTAKIVREDGVSELKKDHLYMTPSYTKHAYECDDILELYYIHIYKDPGKNINLFDQIKFPVERLLRFSLLLFFYYVLVFFFYPTPISFSSR